MDKKTDVLLVNPTRVGVDAYCTPPLHLMYLKQALRESGYDAQMINVHEISMPRHPGRTETMKNSSM